MCVCGGGRCLLTQTSLTSVSRKVKLSCTEKDHRAGEQIEEGL
jgi:hypothetical protein